ncbi:MAG: hypothetical protein RBS22_10455, partial [Spongiibacteraceae bacterium]|nr:hypothetical protein [Spongiibacteraceae bacterium]
QGRGVLLTDGGSAPQISTYNERLCVLDPFVDLPPGQVKSLLELVNEDAWLNSELYQVCMAPAGLHDSLAVDVQVEGDFQAGLRAARGPMTSRSPMWSGICFVP